MKRTSNDHEIDYFTINSFTPEARGFHLTQEYDEDSRKVVDSDGNVHLVFTASLDVILVQGDEKRQIGRLESGEGKWGFHSFFEEEFPSSKTECELGDYDWRELQRAEIVIATRILEKFGEKN